jgi:hypothetical protein
MRDYSEQIIIYKETATQKFNRLSDWEKFVVITWLLGWTHGEIGERAGLTSQAVSWTFVKAKKKMGVYWSTL